MESEFQQERVYVFVTAFDERVCPVCAPLHGSEFGEQEVSILFPSAYQVDDQTLRANLHKDIPLLYGECRCELQVKESLLTTVQGDEQVSEESGFAYWRIGRAVYSLRSPQAAARYGLREAFKLAGLGTLAATLVPMIFFLILPLIRAAIKLQFDTELQKRIDQVNAERTKDYRQMYRRFSV